MKLFFSKIISLLFPETCVICGKTNTSLCQDCIQKLPKATFLENPWMHSLFSYQNKQVRKVVHTLKFSHTQSIAHHLGPHIHELIQNTISDKIKLDKNNLITLLPVPKMQLHLNTRGFDAVLALCESIKVQDTNQYVIENTSIIRVNTKAQVGLSRQERLLNMKDAFKVKDTTALLESTVCIIDDVITTGSTLRELKKVCLAAGAKEVFAVTIAH